MFNAPVSKGTPCRTPVRGALLALAVVSALVTAGCDLQLVGDQFSLTLSDPTTPAPTEGTVRVAFSNGSSAALDVNFYVSATPLAAVPDDLFVEDNLTTSGIGLGGNGRLGPDTVDSVEVDCADGLTLGTSGGTFVDTETGEELGTGAQRWIIQGAQFDCGDTILIEYRENGDEYETSLTLGF